MYYPAGPSNVTDVFDRSHYGLRDDKLDNKTILKSGFSEIYVKEEIISDDSENETNCDIKIERRTSSEDELEEGGDEEDLRENVNRESESEENVYYYGRNNCFKWNKEPKTYDETTGRNADIDMLSPGLRTTIKEVRANPDAVEVWGLLFTDEILNEICRWTNVSLQKLKERRMRKDTYTVHDIDVTELNAIIGLILFMVVYKSGNETVDSLFSTDGTGRDIFRCTMTHQRFLYMLQSLRFDNPDDKDERKIFDVVASISKTFDRLLENSRRFYSLGSAVRVDEIYVPFRGQCEFSVHLPKTADKYGLKIMCLTDAMTNYLYNAYIYSGKENSVGDRLRGEYEALSIPSRVVVRLVEPIRFSGRNVTADRWFSSIELVSELLKTGLTYTGTMQIDKEEIPPQFLPRKERKKNTSVYGFTDDITLISFVPKKSDAIILVSSKHHNESDDPATGRPEMIAYYDRTNRGLEVLNVVRVNHTTWKWRTAVFSTMVALVSGVNAFVLHQSFERSEKMERLEFIKKLAMSLVLPQIHRRYSEIKKLPRELISCIRRIINIHRLEPNSENETVQREEFEVRKTCSFCPPKLKRRTRYPCQQCGAPICLQCAKTICKNCFTENRC